MQDIIVFIVRKMVYLRLRNEEAVVSDVEQNVFVPRSNIIALYHRSPRTIGAY